MSRLPGVIPSPNIWGDAEAYEQENLALDPAGALEEAIRNVHDWNGERVLDIGCGTGFHLPRFAARAAHVCGVEPHPPLLALARRRIEGLDPGLRQRVAVHSGSAEQLPLAPASVDVAHARWAYFFGPGCQPGLAELRRVMRPGGTAFVIDNDATRSTFGRWFRIALPDYDSAAVERFWTRQGWTRVAVEISWAFADRASFERVVGIEFAPPVAERILAEHDGTEVDYAVNLWHKTFA